MESVSRSEMDEVIDLERGGAHFLLHEADSDADPPTIMLPDDEEFPDEELLPQCKIKRNYLCTLCTYFTQNPRSYLHHLKSVHNEKIRIYECPHCLYASKHSQKLQRHVTMVHDPEKEAKSLKCLPKRKVHKVPKMIVKVEPKPSTSTSNMDDDDANSFNDDDSTDRLVIEAPEYEEQEEEESAEADAVMRGVVESEFQCSLCEFQSRSQTLVARHERIVHLKKKFFRCSKCSYVTHLKARYTKHVKYHTMPLIKCSICDFRTPYKWNLDRHLKNHNTSGSFKCSACNFSADIKQSLTVHEMNHHVPPVGSLGNADRSPRPQRKRNKVGGSECYMDDEADSSQRSRPETSTTGFDILESSNSGVVPIPRSFVMTQKKDANQMASMTTDATARTKPLRCSQCDYRSAYIADMSRHLTTAHGSAPTQGQGPPPTLTAAPPPPTAQPSKRIPRPLPNLIPIQPKPTAALGRQEKQLSDRDLNEICAKSCPTSSLKDFAPIIGDDEAFRNQDDEDSLNDHFPSGDEEYERAALGKRKRGDYAEHLTVKYIKEEFPNGMEENPSEPGDSMSSCGDAGHAAGSNTSVNTNDASNLVCVYCGHEAKTSSELVRHQKLHNGPARRVMLTSTRCQHCRHRCKSSTDLLSHLKTCTKAKKTRNEDESSQEQPDDDDSHPMENKIFVWNNPLKNAKKKKCSDEGEYEDQGETSGVSDRGSGEQGAGESSDEGEEEATLEVFSVPTADPNLVGVETAPGYGAVTTQDHFDSATGPKILQTVTTVKKVFKCPHCSFWASTASRFHVHIVGHLNKKPFECSLCNYRSNWRWDITKHIRLKAVRDPAHDHAKVLMTDETGRRNYSKYNKNLTFMKVAEPNAENLLPPGTRQSKAAANGTQGNMPGPVEPVPILPAPPKLTRAPVPRSSVQVPQILPGTMLRPPPPLQAATHLIILNTLPCGVRVEQPGQIQPATSAPEQQQQQQTSQATKTKLLPQPIKKLTGEPLQTLCPPDPNKTSTEIKKTVWRCKQCHFRDGDRAIVLAHVKGHYRQHQEEALRQAKQKELAKNGSVKKPDTTKQTPESLKGKSRSDKFHCTLCPFVTTTDLAFRNHSLFHKPKPDAIFKCYFCPYYVNSKDELLQHMNVHSGKNWQEELVQKPLQPPPSSNKIPEVSPSRKSVPVSRTEAHKTESPTVKVKLETPVESSPSEPSSKRYRCVQCPYVSNSKSQFLYHKQFHRPRDAAYKCNHCSYNVSRRHLLHQHLRVHGIVVSPAKVNGSKASEPAENEEESAPQPEAPMLDFNRFTETPVCWVLRNGKLIKMFKCRFCPHVNVRKTNIVEHERMHGKRTNLNENDENGSTQYSPYPCPECSYVCNNAGVLSSHMKVHWSSYPKPFGFVDSTRNDDVQVKELCEKYDLPLSPNGIFSSNDNFSEPETERKLNGLNLMSLLNPNQSLTDAVIAMKKKFNLELDGEPFAEPQEDTAESPPCSPMKHLDGSTQGSSDEKKLHFCHQCPARFLYRKELGIHARFHNLHLIHRCENCSYTARQRTHLQAHFKVHTDEYQERTRSLLNMYSIHEDNPMPRTVALQEVAGIPGPIWVVVNAVTKPNESSSSSQVSENGKLKFQCPKCPATFFKALALQYHNSLHGGDGPHKCADCDYAVKTYGNLVKHMVMHSPTKPTKSSKSDVDSPQQSIQSEVTEKESKANENDDLMDIDQDKELKQRNDFGLQDAQVGQNTNGSSNFVYPTYLKNGRIKEKRYKCPKCPSAFEKREQYKIHFTLHGSKQNYTCNKCDYSVKYYANYIQHLNRHDRSEKANSLNGSDEVSSEKEMSNEEGEDDENIPVNTQTSAVSPQRSVKSTGGNCEKSSIADQQAMIILNQTRLINSAASKEAIDKNYRCSYCPYSCPRRDQIESHMKKHISVSGVRNSLTCQHCDFSVTSKHLIRDHTAVHFDLSKMPRPSAYMICDRLELYATSQNFQKRQSEGKVLIFQDKGTTCRTDRFMPRITDEESEEKVSDKILVNFNAFERETRRESRLERGDDSSNSSSELDAKSESNDGFKAAKLDENKGTDGIDNNNLKPYSESSNDSEIKQGIPSKSS